MRLTATLTSHARERLNTRTQLNPSDLQMLLDNYRTVSVGYESHSYRWHRLFFSVPDRCHFVAIQDVKTGEVITILPLDYHANLGWKISVKTMRRAVSLVSNRIAEEMYPAVTLPPRLGIKATAIGYFWTTPNKTDSHPLGSYRFNNIPEVEEDVLQDDTFVEKLISRINNKGLSMTRLDEVWLANNKRNFFIVIP